MIHCLVAGIVADKRRGGKRRLLVLVVGMLVWVSKGVVVLELGRHMIEGRHVHHSTAGESVDRGSLRQRRIKAHTYPQAWSVEVARLVMIERIVSTRRSVVVWRLVCERGEGERVWIEEGRSKSPWIVLCSGSRIEVLCIFAAQAVMSSDIQLVYRHSNSKGTIVYVDKVCICIYTHIYLQEQTYLSGND